MFMMDSSSGSQVLKSKVYCSSLQQNCVCVCVCACVHVCVWLCMIHSLNTPSNLPMQQRPLVLTVLCPNRNEAGSERWGTSVGAAWTLLQAESSNSCDHTNSPVDTVFHPNSSLTSCTTTNFGRSDAFRTWGIKKRQSRPFTCLSKLMNPLLRLISRVLLVNYVIYV